MDKFDVAVIGAGPAGYTAAIRASQLGFKVACIDRGNPGGTCLNVGCIPSKALLQSSYKYWDALHHFADHGIEAKSLKANLSTIMARKETVVNDLVKGVHYLFKKNKITFIEGAAQLKGNNQISINQKALIEAKHIVIATGSETVIPHGIKVDEKHILTSTGALSLTSVPKHLIVIGGGYIGVELGSVWQRLGADVTIIENAESITPSLDREVSMALQKSLEKQGIKFLLSARVESIKEGKSGIEVTIKQGTKTHTLKGDKALVAVGRKPVTDNLGLQQVGVQKDERGRIVVNERYEATASGIYAIGDVIPGPMLAHKGAEEGVAVAEILAGQHGMVNYMAIPAVVYTFPEVASVGKTEEELKQAGAKYKIGKYAFANNSRAKVNGEKEGFVKVLTDAETDQILGVHIIGPEAGTLIAEAVIAMEYSASAEDIARVTHAHPTLPEAFKEAALDVDGRSLNK